MYLFLNAASPLSFIRVFFDDYCTVISFIRVFFDDYCTVMILGTNDSAASHSAMSMVALVLAQHRSVLTVRLCSGMCVGVRVGGGGGGSGGCHHLHKCSTEGM